MSNNSWSKTALEAYRYLPRVCYAYDKIIKTRACNSAYYGESTTFNSVENVIKFIIDMSERKKNLINLKLSIVKALKSIDKKNAKILIFRFIDGKKFCELAEIFKVSMRTLFRRINVALDSFESVMQKLGFGNKEMNKMFVKERWIMDIYDSYNSKIDMTFADNINLGKTVQSNIVRQFRSIVSFS